MSVYGRGDVVMSEREELNNIINKLDDGTVHWLIIFLKSYLSERKRENY